MDFNKILVIAKRNNLPHNDIETIREYLEHREWGIAFEQLCSAIEDEEIVITEDDYALIEEIGNIMNMDKKLWRCLKHKK
ncbi:MafI family immunity protein [Acetivibrio saccincola]|jgi:hypothetical protein|uniref:MafI family immunity protein n=1 Tax=Acetivibrio saccincola TaxID=1677857 RepID=A0A2K9E9Q5_9FIRM|nr:MafI family immunity protein [Acetivibrio saccincola]AUG56754.1 hypothetical protein HVS_04060 [Acetivibrio saccincola]NLP45323.1 MafI family immunity protein [Peptococcaceae bacterium]PQQ66809.1 hypothetical protein B9R14_08675 [Acetivibrio saccincola]